MSYELLVIGLKWLPKIFFGAVFLLALFRKFNFPKLWKLNFHILIGATVVFRLFYAALLTISQYYVWSQNKFTQLLLNSPGYFSFYSYGRFWLNVFISIAVAFVFYLFLKSLQKHRARFFEEGETELGFLSALIVGWPNFVVFLPLVFIFVILTSIFRRVFLKQFYTTLGAPFLLAVFPTLIFGNKLITLLNLNTLYI